MRIGRPFWVVRTNELGKARDGAIIFSDLIGKPDVLYVHCPQMQSVALVAIGCRI